MTGTEKLHFCPGDWLAVVLVVVLAISVMLCFLPRNENAPAVAEIYLNGQLIKTVSLAENQIFSIQDKYVNQVTVTDHGIAITASDCPGQDCVHSGKIQTSGRSLVCLPNALEIRVVSQVSDVDFVVG